MFRELCRAIGGDPSVGLSGMYGRGVFILILNLIGELMKMITRSNAAAMSKSWSYLSWWSAGLGILEKPCRSTLWLSNCAVSSTWLESTSGHRFGGIITRYWSEW